MFDARSLCFFLLLAGFAGASLGVEVVQCEDDNGHRTFEKHCPPGTTEVGKHNYGGTPGTSATTGAAAERPPITMYVVPECDACDQFMEFFNTHGIAITTRDVKDDAVVQAELKQKSGELRAPTVMVGDKPIVGYNRGALMAALKEAGYLPGDDSGAETEAGGNEEEQNP